MIKTVIFDLGGVYFTDGTKKAIITISEKYKIPEQKVKEVLQGTLGTKYRIGEVTPEEFWKQAKEQLNLNVETKELSNMWLEGYKLISGTADIIDRLNKAGYKVLFLSDNIKERVDYLEEKYKFLAKFKGGIFSHEVYIRKPDPRIYEMALSKASNPPEECVYIDDKPELLKPAEALGMHVLAFQGPRQLEKALQNKGLQF
ncbi:MAG: HAD family phosphatase [Candidatus Woesearchaeota archaeon]